MRLAWISLLLSWLAACADGHDLPAGDAGATDSATSDAPVAADFTSCTFNGECVVVANSCCGACGAPEITSVVAVNQVSAAAHHDFVCAGAPQMCPACPTRLNSNLVAACESGSCVARDIRQEPYTACATNEDCRTRSAACCECENAVFGPYIAINASTDTLSAYESVVCNASTTCSSVMACQAYPSGTPTAFCDAETLHCVLPPDA